MNSQLRCSFQYFWTCNTNFTLVQSDYVYGQCY